MIHNLYIFNRTGSLLHYEEWQPRTERMSLDQEAKLLFGALFSLKGLMAKISPVDVKPNEALRSFKTGDYQLTHFESPSGVQLVLFADTSATGLRELLSNIYTQAYVDCCVKNPLRSADEPISSSLFKERLNDLVSRHPAFRS